MRRAISSSVSGGADALKIRIADEGEGFEVSNLPDPLAEENLLRHSGRGIFLIRAFMDEVDIQPVSPQGTEVTLVKKKEVA